MKKSLLSVFILIIYIAILIKVMVFKDIPTIRIGQLMLNFAGTDANGNANFVPFKTILPYLLGDKGWIIAGINLAGNIIPLVPLGFLLPFVYRNMTGKKSFVLAVVAGLVIEVMQTVLNVGIFDIDDVILNALGVIIGYLAFVVLSQWLRSKKYVNIIITIVIIIAAAFAALYVIYPKGQKLRVPSGVGAGGVRSNQLGEQQEGAMPKSGDLCNGTGGNGQIVSKGVETLTIKRKDGINRIIHLTNQTTIKTSTGSASESYLRIGDKITLVGGPNPDGSFSANTIVVCEGK